MLLCGCVAVLFNCCVIVLFYCRVVLLCCCIVLLSWCCVVVWLCFVGIVVSLGWCVVVLLCCLLMVLWCWTFVRTQTPAVDSNPPACKRRIVWTTKLTAVAAVTHSSIMRCVNHAVDYSLWNHLDTLVCICPLEGHLSLCRVWTYMHITVG